MPQHNDHNAVATWLTQLQQGDVTTTSTRRLATQLRISPPVGLKSLLQAIADDSEEATVSQWLDEWLHDKGANFAATPTFDYSFLTAPSAPSSAVLPKIAETVSAVKQQVSDQLQTLTIWFQHIPEILAAPPHVAWVTRGARSEPTGQTEEGQKLFQYSLPEDDTIWGGEVSAFVEDGALCRVEIAIFRLDTLTASLDNIPISLQYADKAELLYTDSGGVVEFMNIPQTRLAEIVVQINPDTRSVRIANQ